MKPFELCKQDGRSKVSSRTRYGARGTLLLLPPLSPLRRLPSALLSCQNTEANTDLQGASPQELLVEAARRNNTDLLKEVIDGCGSAEKAAVLLNETKTVLGNYIYHEAASRGNCACHNIRRLSQRMFQPAEALGVYAERV